MHHAQRLGFNDARTLRINDPDVCDAKVCLGSLIRCRMKGCHAEPLIFKQEEDIDLTDPNWRRREMLKKMKNPENSRLVLYETTLSMAWRRKFIHLLLRRFKPPMTSLLSPDFIVRANALWNSVSKDALLDAEERGEQTPNCALTAQRARDAKEKLAQTTWCHLHFERHEPRGIVQTKFRMVRHRRRRAAMRYGHAAVRL